MYMICERAFTDLLRQKTQQSCVGTLALTDLCLLFIAIPLLANTKHYHNLYSASFTFKLFVFLSFKAT